MLIKFLNTSSFLDEVTGRLWQPGQITEVSDAEALRLSFLSGFIGVETNVTYPVSVDANLICTPGTIVWQPVIGSATGATFFNMSAPVAVGNVSRSMSAVLFGRRWNRRGIQTSGVIGNISSLTSAVAIHTVGSGSLFDLSGFTFECEVVPASANLLTSRAFIGVTDDISNPSNVEPSAIMDTIAIAKLSTSNNWHIVWGGSVAQTPINLGNDFPVDTNGSEVYRVKIVCPSERSDMATVTLTRMSNLKSVTKVLIGEPGVALPAPDLFLGFKFWITNNDIASSLGMDICWLQIGK